VYGDFSLRKVKQDFNLTLIVGEAFYPQFSFNLVEYAISPVDRVLGVLIWMMQN
jgi:hypothetical protein